MCDIEIHPYTSRLRRPKSLVLHTDICIKSSIQSSEIVIIPVMSFFSPLESALLLPLPKMLSMLQAKLFLQDYQSSISLLVRRFHSHLQIKHRDHCKTSWAAPGGAYFSWKVKPKISKGLLHKFMEEQGSKWLGRSGKWGRVIWCWDLSVPLSINLLFNPITAWALRGFITTQMGDQAELADSKS